MTHQGGVNNDGTIFGINTDGSGFQTLLSFSGTNGAYPQGSLTLSGSRLYGMTASGGSNNDGTVSALNIAPASIVLNNISNTTIISGGTATFGATVSNSPNAGYNLNYTLTANVQSGNATLGTMTSGTGWPALRVQANPAPSQPRPRISESTRFLSPRAIPTPPIVRRRPLPP